ncbi:MAG: hydantoinase/oxoprolinase family protein [Proteobacteria bacterium]|nr:hydantoinase/oxoprolinase family protein [Pseudomonadota bacterium]
MLRIGIDIGGTFTDFAVWREDEGGYTAIHSFKVPSTPPSFADAVREGLDSLIERFDIPADEEILLVHGTTVSTNAVIERSGPPLAFLTTKGFPDILNLQRLRLEKPVDMFSNRPPSLIPRELVFEIDERILADGSVDRPIDAAEVAAAALAAKEAGATGIAVCFLNSYRNPAHENAAGAAIAAVGNGLDVTLSSALWPQQNEYERAIVAVLNAYVKTAISSYVAEVEEYLHERLPRARLFITRSNGGVMAARVAYDEPVHTLLSGPAAGVTAACFVGEMVGSPNLLTMDMGGTSTDMSLIRDCLPQVSSQAEVGDFPLMMPVTAIEAMGAGGGSIAWMDGPVLKVGPKSAGARPGPACYGQGGKAPTLSDAYLLCGYLNPDFFLGGRMGLREDLAEAAMRPLAEAMNVDVVTAAESCVAVASSNMLTKVLPFLARLGVSPRELTLVLFGGAGAVHGPLLADEVGIDRVLVPRTPSVFCAFGGIVSDLMHDAVRTVHGLNIESKDLIAAFGEIAGEARSWLAEQVEPEWLGETHLEYHAEMRYIGQSFQVDVSLPETLAAAGDMRAISDAFHREHERLFNHCDPGAAVEFTQLRVRIRGRMRVPGRDGLAVAESIEEAKVAVRRARFGGRWRDDVGVFRRERLAPGNRVPGPAIIEQVDATVLVPPAYSAEVGEFGDLMLVKEG